MTNSPPKSPRVLGNEEQCRSRPLRFGSSCLLALIFLLSASPALCRATETENLGMRALPAPAHVEIDGKFDDWDLSGGIFICGDVENARTQNAVWFHLMYDAENLYVLARW